MARPKRGSKAASAVKKTVAKKAGPPPTKNPSKSPRQSKRKSGQAQTTQEPEPDYSKMTVAQLKKECALKDIDSTGKKADLIARLNGDEQEGPPTKVAKLQKQSTLDKAAAAIVSTGTGVRKTFKPDKQCALANSGDCEVHEDYDCMLNKTDIVKNNNKYYLIQVLSSWGEFFAWNRWGRVGDPPGCFHGQKLHGPFAIAEGAVKSFEAKFWDKTRTRWADRANYKAVKGKYTLLEMGEEEEDSVEVISMDNRLQVTAKCTLDDTTQALVQFVFDTDMFKKAMIQLSFDVKKMPLGKLSKIQIAKGFQILGEIRNAIDKNSKSQLTELTSKFYTAVPHSFGWKRPPVINSREQVQEKVDNLLVLGDIELAQALQKSHTPALKAKKEDLPPHPLDVKYQLLQCDLERLNESSHEFKAIKKYLEVTKGGQVKSLKNVWKMDRKPERDRFKAHDKLSNRRLLWHGTNVAVVAAILKEGLRIMPHSGGRVGRGIYFASENAKSAAYTRPVDKKGIMFLNEVALGNPKEITNDDSSLTSPPKGFDSVIARGQQEPDPKNDVTITLDGKKVAVPQAQPKSMPGFKGSSFCQSEYLVYSETQARMRYLLQLEWSY